MFNSFGNIFRLTSFGESHGPGVGGVIDGFPAGIDIDMDFVQKELNRRRPGQSLLTTSRKEPDTVEFLSGIFDGKSTGCPIGFVVWNKNQHSNDYENIKNLFRPSHADYTYMEKYGIRDYRGGGRSSARETISRVVAGSLAKLALKQLGISVTAYTSQVGPIKLDHDYKSYDLDLIESNDVRCPDLEKAKEMAELIWKVKGEGDTIGGVISCVIKGCPIGLGQPVFGKLHAALGNAMLSINAVKGFAYGQGFDSMELRGSEQNDVFYNNGGSHCRSDGSHHCFRLLFDRQNHSTIKSVFIKKPKEPNSLSASLWTFYICIFLYLSFIIFFFPPGKLTLTRQKSFSYGN